MAFFHSGNTRKRQGFSGVPFAASCGGRLHPQSANGGTRGRRSAGYGKYGKGQASRSGVLVRHGLRGNDTRKVPGFWYGGSRHLARQTVSHGPQRHDADRRRQVAAGGGGADGGGVGPDRQGTDQAGRSTTGRGFSPPPGMTGWRRARPTWRSATFRTSCVAAPSWPTLEKGWPRATASRTSRWDSCPARQAGAGTDRSAMGAPGSGAAPSRRSRRSIPATSRSSRRRYEKCSTSSACRGEST
jgi:hypothetical protein